MGNHGVHKFTPDRESLQKGRYLLFLDLLGFSTFVENNPPDKIYKAIDAALQSLRRWEELNKLFKIIYFSDTVLFYQESEGYGDWAFLDVYAIGAMGMSALLAKEIPVRGSITFGEFEVRNDSSSKHQVYFGKALVEACKSEKKENWIGITIQPSAWQPYEAFNQGVVKAFESERVWKRRHDECLLLNPFIKLRGGYADDLVGEIDRPYMEWDAPEFPNDILGFKFLRDKAEEYANRGDYSGKEAAKYHSTIAFLKDVLGKEIYEWGEKLANDASKA